MKSHENNQGNSDINRYCDKETDAIVFTLTSRRFSWMVSGFLMLSFFIFMAGYFLGQRKVLADFSCKVEQESLGDAIFSSVYSLYTNRDSMDSSDDEGSSEIVEATPELCDSQEVLEVNKHDEEVPLVQKSENSAQYYAELIGFGTETAAQSFAARMQKDGIPVNVKKRVSKTARGKQIAWYQVITEKFCETEPLLDLVRKLEKKEHLKANIQMCS